MVLVFTIQQQLLSHARTGRILHLDRQMTFLHPYNRSHSRLQSLTIALEHIDARGIKPNVSLTTS